jgi:hypothetical protein
MSKRLGNPGGADAMTTQFGGVSAAMPKGTPLRMITRTTAPDQSGTPREVTTTMEIVEFNHAPTNPALFAVPDGYETMDMRKMLAKLPAGMLDSVTKAAAEKAPVDLCGGAN